MNKRTHQSGFGVIGVLLALVVLTAVGGAGWYVWHARHNADKTPISDNSTAKSTNKKEAPAAKVNQLSLDSGTAKMTMPTSWTYITSTSGCFTTASAKNVTCREGATITPGVKLPTVYGNETEFFQISASLYDNSMHHSAKEFIQNDLSMGVPSEDDTTSNASINNYDTYSWNVNNDDYHELWYAFSTQNNVVVIYARTYEPGTSKGKPAGDFRQFEPDIIQMAESISIVK